MDENDAKVRRQWLIVFILNMVNSALWCTLNAFFNPLSAQVSGVFTLMGGLAGLIGVGYPIYRCIYQKPGTKLVTALLIICVLSFLSMPVLLFSGKMTPPYTIPFYGVLQAISYLISICWIVACWRIRKVNRKLQLAVISKS